MASELLTTYSIRLFVLKLQSVSAPLYIGSSIDNPVIMSRAGINLKKEGNHESVKKSGQSRPHSKQVRIG